MTAKRPDETVERERTELLKLRRASYDRATGLPTFPLLFDQLRTCLDSRRHLGVIHVEIANLDMVESLYGWQVFDRILAKVSGILQDARGKILPRQTLLGISGVAGDRFVGFLPDSAQGEQVDLDLLARVGDRIRASLEAAFDTEEFAGLSPKLSFRTGHALLSEDPFYRFERRVYGAVEEARTLSARREQRREQSWGAELKRIIQDSAVSTVFQPVVDLETREVLGFEAFARGPKDSFFEMPQAMFALSARVGVAADLDRLCRHTAIKNWGRGEGHGKVFLNVLPTSLADPTWLSGGMEELIEAASLRPIDLVIEISERAADSDLEEVTAVMERLKGQGFSLALDDVGTGYATLATLEKVKPDFLKVDVSVIRDIHLNLIKQELLASLVQIASRIEASVIAEGIELEEEAAALRDAGVRYGQGFLFAGPESRMSEAPTGKSRTIDH